jgi:predicted amidophosphoribosyltransferase
MPGFAPARCPCGRPWDQCPWRWDALNGREPRATCHGCGADQPYGRIRCDQCGKPLVFPVSFVCPRCGAVSHNPNDVCERYCGRCHVFVDDQAKPFRVPLLSMVSA